MLAPFDRLRANGGGGGELPCWRPSTGSGRTGASELAPFDGLRANGSFRAGALRRAQGERRRGRPFDGLRANGSFDGLRANGSFRAGALRRAQGERELPCWRPSTGSGRTGASELAPFDGLRANGSFRAGALRRAQGERRRGRPFDGLRASGGGGGPSTGSGRTEGWGIVGASVHGQSVRRPASGPAHLGRNFRAPIPVRPEPVEGRQFRSP